MATSSGGLGSTSAPAAVVLVISVGLGVLALWIVTRARPSSEGAAEENVPVWRRAL